MCERLSAYNILATNPDSVRHEIEGPISGLVKLVDKLVPFKRSSHAISAKLPQALNEVIRRELATQALEESCYLAKKLVDVFVAVPAP